MEDNFIFVINMIITVIQYVLSVKLNVNNNNNLISTNHLKYFQTHEVCCLLVSQRDPNL